MKRCFLILLVFCFLTSFAACSAGKKESTDPSVMAETYVGEGFTTIIRTLVGAELAKTDSRRFDLTTLTVTVTEKDDNTCTFRGTIEEQKDNGKSETRSFKGTADCHDGKWQICKIHY